jgi:hypothetical protein
VQWTPRGACIHTAQEVECKLQWMTHCTHALHRDR